MTKINKPERDYVKPLLSGYAALVYLFLFAPVFVVIYMSFNSAKTNIFPLSDYSLQWYQKLFQNSSIWQSFTTSAIIALVSTFLVLVLGTCAAYVIVRHSFRWKSAFIALVLAPMLIPSVITGISMLLFYSFLDVRTSIITVILGHSVLTLPYATMNITARLQGFHISQEDAARNLGANEWDVFFRVVLPQIKSGLISGALFAFTISMDEFALTFFVNSANSQTLPIRIYSMLRFGLTPELNALSTIILCISFGLVTLAMLAKREKHKNKI